MEKKKVKFRFKHYQKGVELSHAGEVEIIGDLEEVSQIALTTIVNALKKQGYYVSSFEILSIE